MATLSEAHQYPVTGKVYARIEGSDGFDSDPAPRDQDEAPNAVISFDAVHADWFGASQESFFAFDGLEERVGDYWNGMFGGERVESPDDPYEPVPALRIEVSLRPDHRWIAQVLDARDQWVELNLGESGEHRVDVYRGLFDPAPVSRRVSGAPKPIQDSQLATQLSTAFDMNSWPNGSDKDLKGVFDTLPPIEQLISFDVGQGTATCLARACRCILCRDALDLGDHATVAYGKPSWSYAHLSRCIEEACESGLPVCYFDLGCGVYRNARTRPHDIRFCNCSNPPVILSHWDADHWAGALEDTRFLRSRWVAPRQSIGPTHAKFASKILQSGGSILIVPDHPRSVSWSGHCELVTLQRATGSGRNDSGLVMQVWNRCEDKNWLLTGDADYQHIPNLPCESAAIAVPHHGASKCIGKKSLPRPSDTAESRLLYSFGPGNKHGRYGVSHPRRATVDAHLNAGWKSPGWDSGTPGGAVAHGTTLATAQHPSTHLKWAAAGWDRTPPPPGQLMRCLGVTTPPQT